MKKLFLCVNLSKLLLLFVVVFVTTLESVAQKKCDDLIVRSLQKYKDGLYDDMVNELVAGYRSCDLSRQEKKEALKLLSAANYAMDELEEGNKYLISFLKKDPNYIPQKGIDPTPFIEAFPKFRITPKFSVHAKVGLIENLIDRTLIQKVWERADYSKSYEVEPSFQANFGIQWYPFRNVFFAVGVEYSEVKFSRYISAENVARITYDEEANSVAVPIHIGFDIPIHKRIYPTIIVGFTTSGIGKAEADLKLDYLSDENNPPSTNMNNVDISALRAPLNFSLDVGGKLNLRYKNLIYSLEYSYSYPVLSYSQGNSYNQAAFLNDYFYADDTFSIHRSTLQFGISYIFSNHIKFKY